MPSKTVKGGFSALKIDLWHLRVVKSTNFHYKQGDFIYLIYKTCRIERGRNFYPNGSVLLCTQCRSGNYTVVTDKKELYTLVPSGDFVPWVKSSWIVIQLSNIFLFLFFIIFLWLSSRMFISLLSSAPCCSFRHSSLLCIMNSRLRRCSLALTTCCFLSSLLQ